MTAVPPNPTPTGGVASSEAPPAPAGTGDGFSWRRFLMMSGLILVLGAGAVVLLWVIGSNLGLRATIIGIGAAILPVPILVVAFLWLGRYQPTPAKYLVFAFAWGACVATSVSLGVNTFGGYLLSEQLGEGWLADTLTAVAVAPVIEELTKALGPLLIFVFRRRYFTGIIDGIVYCGLSAVGFAMMENILYLGGSFAMGDSMFGTAGGALTTAMLFVVRIVLTGFAHPLFTAMFGIGLGLAIRRRSLAAKIAVPTVMLLASMVLHSAWNLFASLSATVLASGYLSIMVPIFATTVGGALWLRASEARLAVHVLPDYVAGGWLSPPEVAALATYRRRASARLWAKRVSGDEGLKAMREYQHVATQLALLRDRYRRGLATPDDPAREHYLLTTLVACRGAFAGRDPSMPRAVWDGRYYQVQFPDGSVRQVNPPAQPVMPIPIAIDPFGGGYARPPAMPWMRG
ncbi:PrsW family intramembrane metalloprotease [Stackebrandtia soli]|uniref:PrsW family intramembrane metalloprotease n=1 Tax=Stackebrandtia soli TaxID=1892856 RepID=UPI0039EADB25